MKRGKFSLSHYRLSSFNMGKLIPVGCFEVLPGDSIQQASSALVRIQPLLAPMMHQVDIRIHHWYVPTRLIWEDFEDFITGGPDGMDASVYPTRVYATAAGVGSLLDHLGGVPGVAGLEVSVLPMRAYGLIWNEWYRDQDLQTPRTVLTTSGADGATSLSLADVCWEKDYYTSSRPWPQKGAEVTIPIGDEAPVIFEETGATPGVRTLRRSSASADQELRVHETGTNDAPIIGTADLAGATAVSVNELRVALALQRYAEARARYGSRYTEYLRYLGVRSSDARLQRPEYLGGGRQPLQVSEVLQTAPTTDGDDEVGVGNLKGHGIGALRTARYRRFFEEHGYILSLISVKPKTIYASGLNRHWNRRTKEDFWQRELQHVGQQEVLKKEVYAASADPNGVFGYQDRYDEYRRVESGIAGEFRTDLDFWHMARIFGTEPSLNSAFVAADPTTRIYPATEDNQLWVMTRHSIQARRMVTQVGTSFIY